MLGVILKTAVCCRPTCKQCCHPGVVLLVLPLPFVIISLLLCSDVKVLIVFICGDYMEAKQNADAVERKENPSSRSASTPRLVRASGRMFVVQVYVSWENVLLHCLLVSNYSYNVFLFNSVPMLFWSLCGNVAYRKE